MFKRKIKIMAVMLSLVILVACVGDTFSKYTATNYTTVDMDIEMPYNSNLHGDSMLSPDELYSGITYTVKDAQGNDQTVTCRVLIDTSVVSIALSDNKKYLRITTHKQITGEFAGYCFDPFVVLNFQLDFEAHGMEGYKFSHTDDKTKVTTDYYGLPTSSVRYAVIPYYVPYVDPKTLPKYEYTSANGTTKYSEYSTYNYDHLRVYTATTLNTGSSHGVSRFQECSRMIGDLEGTWMCAVIDLAQTNLKGAQGGANGIPNWEGNLYQLRLDIGQIGGSEAWYERYDCPDGMTMYLGEIRFFSSLYAAERAVQNLYYSSDYANVTENGKLKAKYDPTTFSFTEYEDVVAYKNGSVYTTMSYAQHVQEENEKLNAGNNTQDSGSESTQ